MREEPEHVGLSPESVNWTLEYLRINADHLRFIGVNIAEFVPEMEKAIRELAEFQAEQKKAMEEEEEEEEEEECSCHEKGHPADGRYHNPSCPIHDTSAARLEFLENAAVVLEQEADEAQAELVILREFRDSAIVEAEKKWAYYHCKAEDIPWPEPNIIPRTKAEAFKEMLALFKSWKEGVE